MKRFLISFFAVVTALAVLAFCVLPLPGNIPVLMYHFVGTERMARESKNFVSRKSFENQMWFLHTFGYRVISLPEYEAVLKGERKPRGRELVITFDDGNVTFETDAMPALEKYKFPVTMFLVSENVKTGELGSMREETIKKLAQNSWLDFQGHTRTHPHLSLLSEEEIRAELEGSKADLEAMLGHKVIYLAYPSGDIDDRVLKEAEKAGYHLAFTTAYKKLKAIPEGPYSMAREKISLSSDNPLIFWFKTSGLYRLFKRHRHVMLNPA